MISSTIRKAGPYAGDGSTLVFPFSFKIFATSDVAVFLTDITGAELPELTTGFTVTMNGNQDVSPGGTVTLTTALPVGQTLTLTSEIPATQPMQITNGGGFFPTVLNDSADRITAVVQQLSERVGRTLSAPISSVEPTNALQLPSAAQRAGKYLAFDALGRIVPSLGTGADAGLRGDIAAGGGASLMGWLRATTYGVLRSVASVFSERVSVMDFGAKCDAVKDLVSGVVTGTDDTVAIQHAIDFCLASVPPKALSFPAGGLSKITGALYIDNKLFNAGYAGVIPLGRPIFHIYGNGGGIVRIGDFDAIDTRLPTPPGSPHAPVAQYVTFHDFHAVAQDPTGAHAFLSEKFLRVNFFGTCRFDGMKLFVTDYGYAQQIRCIGAVFSNVKGACVKAVQLYHSDFLENDWEGCQDGFDIGSMIYSHIDNNVFESGRKFVQCDGGLGSTIDGNAIEGNSDVDITATDVAQGGGWKAGGISNNTHIYVGTPITYNVTNGSPTITITSVGTTTGPVPMGNTTFVNAAPGIPNGTSTTTPVTGPGTYTLTANATSTQTGASTGAVDNTFFVTILGNFQGRFKGNYSSWNLVSNSGLNVLPRALDLSKNYAENEVLQGAGPSNSGGIDLNATGRSATVNRHFGQQGHSKFAAKATTWFRWGFVGNENPMLNDGSGLFPGYGINSEGAGETFVIHLAGNPQTYVGAVPFKRGSICWNNSPVLYGPAGWVCITSGSPGTWVPFGVNGQLICNPQADLSGAATLGDTINYINALMAKLRTGKVIAP